MPHTKTQSREILFATCLRRERDKQAEDTEAPRKRALRECDNAGDVPATPVTLYRG